MYKIQNIREIDSVKKSVHIKCNDSHNIININNIYCELFLLAMYEKLKKYRRMEIEVNSKKWYLLI